MGAESGPGYCSSWLVADALEHCPGEVVFSDCPSSFAYPESASIMLLILMYNRFSLLDPKIHSLFGELWRSAQQ
jgi:hypothetical protein